MFTGIVTDIGEVVAVEPRAQRRLGGFGFRAQRVVNEAAALPSIRDGGRAG